MNIKFLFFYVSHSKKKYFQEMFQFFKHSYSKNKQVFQMVPVLENFKHKNNPKNIGPAVFINRRVELKYLVLRYVNILIKRDKLILIPMSYQSTALCDINNNNGTMRRNMSAFLNQICFFKHQNLYFTHMILSF